MPIHPTEFDSVAAQLEPHLVDLPGKLIAIDGRDGVGKTTLGRFLAWYFNVSLIETDLFLKLNKGLSYHTEEIQRLVARRLAIPRPVIIEGVIVLKTLELIDRKPDLLIYVTNSKQSSSDEFADLFLDYERTFTPQLRAHVLIHLAH
jgi:adenylate kinase family enzyme